MARIIRQITLLLLLGSFFTFAQNLGRNYPVQKGAPSSGQIPDKYQSPSFGMLHGCLDSLYRAMREEVREKHIPPTKTVAFEKIRKMRKERILDRNTNRSPFNPQSKVSRSNHALKTATDSVWQVWAQQYVDSGGYDEAYSCAVDSTGNVYVLGYSDINSVSGYVLIKYNSSGDTVWTRFLAGEMTADIAADRDGNVIVTGGSGTAKYSSTGDLIWTRNDMSGCAVTFDDIGNVYVTGIHSAAIRTVMYTSIGIVQWYSDYNGTATPNDVPRAICRDSAGNIYVVGESKGDTTGWDYVTIKYGPAGTQRWAARYNDTANGDDYGKSVAVDRVGNVYVTGCGWENPFYNIVTISYDSLGVEQWVYVDDSMSVVQKAMSCMIALDDSANVYVSGALSYSDMVILKYSPVGNKQWSSKFSYHYYGYSGYHKTFAVDKIGQIYLTGWTDSTTIILKLNSNGIQQWIHEYADLAWLWTYQDYTSELLLDHSGNVYVTGGSYGTGTGPDFMTRKYTSSGILQWEARTGFPGYSSDNPIALCPDGSGNIYVVGNEDNWQTPKILKYSSNGSLLWSKSSGFLNGTYVTGAKKDHAGNLVICFDDITGRSTGGVVKIDADGDSLWTAHFDICKALVVDENDNIYITGGLYDALQHYNYCTAKLSPSGVVQWLRTYNGTGNSVDYGRDISRDSSGNIYVTGYSWNGQNGGIATIKYNASGTQEWVSRVDSSVDLWYSTLAVDNPGNVYVNIYGYVVNSIVKYNTAGTMLWMKTLSGQNLWSILLTDPFDNGVVVYTSNTAIGIIKYDSDGDSLWADKFVCYDVLQDHAGDYYAAGLDSTGHVLKKLSQGGEKKWSISFAGSDGPYCLALDQGYIFATGAKYTNEGINGGFYTVKYAQSGYVSIGSISGNVYNDANANGIKDSSESGLSGWTIYIDANGNGSRDSGETYTTTSSSGDFTFPTLYSGTYRVREAALPGWIQTTPNSLDITITSDTIITGLSFGNIAATGFGYTYVGPSGGNWSNKTNWSGSRVPGPTASVFIPRGSTVLVDSLPYDSIKTMNIDWGGKLKFTANVGTLKSYLEVHNEGTIEFPTGTNGMIVYGDWINVGSFIPGTSTIIFGGTNPKLILPTSFYNLEITGENASTAGNLSVANQFTIQKNLELGISDTITVTNPSANAIQDTGSILRGTIKRAITQGTTDSYRFESPKSFIQFDGSGTYPSSITVTSYPDSLPVTNGLGWAVAGCEKDTVENTVAADSVAGFSRWSFGKPTTQYTQLGLPILRHLYIVQGNGGQNFKARIQMQYLSSEIPDSINKSEICLLHGPAIKTAISSDWNLVSVPVSPDNNSKNFIFPTAISSAFSFVQNKGYQTQNYLIPGSGYWLKFPSEQQVIIVGEERLRDSIPLAKGWNLLGSLSYPVENYSTTSPTLIESPFYAFNGGYLPVDTILPMRSYWVKASANGKIILDTAHTFAKSNLLSNATRSLTECNKITFEDSKKLSQSLYYSVNDSVQIGYYEMPPLPPGGTFDVRYASNLLIEKPTRIETKELPIIIKQEQLPLTVSWRTVSQSGEAYLIINKHRYSLQKSGQAQICDPNPNISLQLMPFEGAETPVSFLLSQNYPDPFNPTTIINYELPVACRVRLKIFDVLGREVKTLIESIQQAGTNKVRWDGDNDNGTKISSGVYFYRLDAISIADAKRNFSQIRKMVLIR